MTGARLRGFGFLMFAGFAAHPAAGQTRSAASPGKWSVGLSIGTSTFTGAAEGQSEEGDRLSFVPHRPTMISGRVGFGGRTRVELALGYGAPGLALRGATVPEADAPGEDVLLVVEGFYDLYQVSAEASRRLAGFHGGPELRGVLGAFAERWSAGEVRSRVIGGVSAGFSLDLALSRRLAARAWAGLGYSPASPFNGGDLPEGFERRGTLRRLLSVGVDYRR